MSRSDRKADRGLVWRSSGEESGTKNWNRVQRMMCPGGHQVGNWQNWGWLGRRPLDVTDESLAGLVGTHSGADALG